jgi:hypothetical protein
MRKTLLLLFVFAAIAIKANAQYVSLSNDEFAKLKNLINTDPTVKTSFGIFETQANKALSEEPDPIERIASEGKLAGDPAKVKTGIAIEDFNKIYALALVYKIDNNKTCLDKATQYLLAWAKVNKSCGDPIDETKLENLIIGYDIVRNFIDPQAKKEIDSWLQSIADGEINSKYMAPGRGTAVNNWNSHRIKIIALITYTLHNTSDEKIVQNELTKHIAINLYADGSGLDFEERDALHYHVYTLEPLITAAMVIYRATGKNYFNYESEKGSSIKKSVDFLVPFVTGEKTHGEFLNSHVAFDKARAKNNEKEYQPGSLFNPLNGVHVLMEAAYFNDKYLAAIKQATSQNSPRHGSEWELVLNRVRKQVGSN